jgi:hypothetical protein
MIAGGSGICDYSLWAPRNLAGYTTEQIIYLNCHMLHGLCASCFTRTLKRLSPQPAVPVVAEGHQATVLHSLSFDNLTL